MPLPSATAAAATAATAAAVAAVAAAAGGEAKAALTAAGGAALTLPAGAAVLLLQGTVVDAGSGVAFELDISPRVFRPPQPRAADITTAAAAATPLLVSCRGAEARANPEPNP